MRLKLNGKWTEARDGETLLRALERHGTAPPTLCDDVRLRPVGECRLCSVEIAGQERPALACTTAVHDGMEVRTDTPALAQFRGTLLEWMAERISPAAMDRFPNKPMHRLLREAEMAPRAADTPDSACDLSHPLIRVDMSQCIACLRCVRICDDVQGQSVWHAIDRGARTHIVPDSMTTLAASSCVGCGACVDTCPTAALTDRREPPEIAQSKHVRTTCGYCGVGCEIDVATDGTKVLGVRPTLDAPVNKGHLCVKGRYAYEFNASPDRVTHPMIREDGAWRRASWDEALDFVANKLRAIVARDGAQAVGVLGSARATNEDNYVAQKFARVVLGTHNVDSCARVCHTPTAAAMKAMLGTGAATNSYDDIERARAILVVGSNADENHPVIGARLRQQIRRGARAIVIDPRRTQLAAAAEVHLALRPGTNVPLLNAIAHVIVTQGLTDAEFIATRVAEWSEFRDFVAAWTPDRAAAICGVSAIDIERAARLYATTKPAICFHGLGVTEHLQGTEGVMTLVNLALLTGNLGKPGTGINPLRGQNNVQGGAHMGCDPGILTGSVAIEEARASFEAVWQASLPRTRGLNLMQMIDAAGEGKLKALWAIGYDIYLTLANAAATSRALERLELLVVQDLFLNETAREFAHVFLPAASVFEKDGTFMNAERRIQRVRRVVDPPGEARPDWKIVRDLAGRMGHRERFAFDSPEAIWNEIRRVWPDGAGISYSRIDGVGLQWPCRDETDPGTTVLHVDAFSRSPATALRRIDYVPTPETTDAQFPFLLTTGRTLYQFNAGTMTGRTANSELRPTDTVDLAPADAERLGIREHDPVRVRSRYGEAVLPARFTRAIQSGQAFATFHDARVFLNRLTGPHRDRKTGAPEYKVTAVSIERIARH